MSNVRGSAHHIRWYVNNDSEMLDAAIFTALPSLASAAVRRSRRARLRVTLKSTHHSMELRETLTKRKFLRV